MDGALLQLLSAEDRKKVVRKASDKMYRFGGRERRQSEAKVTFPCNMAGRNIMLTAEVLQTSFPLLVGNTAMKGAGAVLFIGERKACIMGNEIPMRETESGHFSQHQGYSSCKRDRVCEGRSQGK